MRSLFVAVVAGLVAGCSGSSSATSTGGSGASSTGGSGASSSSSGGGSSTGSVTATLTFDQDGVPKDYSLNAGAGHGIGQINVTGSLKSGSDTSNFDLHVDDPPVAGRTYDCATDHNVLIGLDLLPTTPGGQQPIYSASYNISRADGTPSSCTVTIGSFSGDQKLIEGTFSALVVAGPSSNNSAHLSNGHFKMIFAP